MKLGSADPCSRYVLVFACLLLVGCSSGNMAGNPAPSPTPVPLSAPEFVYANGSNQVAQFTVNSGSGALSAPVFTPLPLPALPSYLAHPAGKFLYVSDQGDSQVIGFSIAAAGGALTPIGGSPFTFLGMPVGGSGPIAIDPVHQFLFFVSDKGGIGISTIDPATGALTPGPDIALPAGISPVAAAVDPAGKFLFVLNQADATTGEVLVFQINQANGNLALVPGSPFVSIANSAPGGLAVHPSGKFLFVSSFAGITPMSIDAATGVLAPLPGSSVPSASLDTNLALHPSGNFIYVTDFVGSTVTGFSVNSTNGALSRIGVFTTGLAPRSVAVDPSGQYLYVANFSGGSISAFFIHSVTGMLSPVPGSPFPAGATLQQLAIAKVP